MIPLSITSLCYQRDKVVITIQTRNGYMTSTLDEIISKNLKRRWFDQYWSSSRANCLKIYNSNSRGVYRQTNDLVNLVARQEKIVYRGFIFIRDILVVAEKKRNFEVIQSWCMRSTISFIRKYKRTASPIKSIFNPMTESPDGKKCAILHLMPDSMLLKR